MSEISFKIGFKNKFLEQPQKQTHLQELILNQLLTQSSYQFDQEIVAPTLLGGISLLTLWT